MFDVLCLSDCCCDLIFQGLPALPAPGEEQYCASFALRAGGGANTPMGLAILGSRVGYAAALGTDILGDVVLEQLRRAGVGERWIRRIPGGRTWVSAALSTQAERSFASFAGDSAAYTERELQEMLAQTRWLHTYSWYAQKYPALLACCQQAGVPVSLDLTYDPAQTLDSLAPLLSQAALMTPNREEALALTGCATVDDALRALAAVCPGVVITLGAEGCAAWLDGHAYIAHPPAVKAVDATGAGDLFNAGLLYARSQGWSAEEQLRVACASGAAAVGCLGGVDEGYTRERVMRLAREVRIEKREKLD